VQINATA